MLSIALRPVIVRSGFALGAEDGKADADSRGEDRGKRSTGFGGQSFLPEPLEKIRWIRQNYPDLDIEVDGGINDQTAPQVVEAGANVLVAGSFIFKSEDRLAAIKKLRVE